MSLYDDLNIDKNASYSEIKEEYKRMVKSHHPDKKDGNNEKFVELKEKFEVLLSPDRRKKYDETGDTNVNSVENQAMQQLSQVFKAVIENSTNVCSDNIIENMKTHINNALSRVNKHIDILEDNKKKYIEVKSRMKNNENLISMIDGFLTECNFNIKNLNKEVNKIDTMLKIIGNANYEYEEWDFKT